VEEARRPGAETDMHNDLVGLVASLIPTPSLPPSPPPSLSHTHTHTHTHTPAPAVEEARRPGAETAASPSNRTASFTT